jgi:predicted alpha/beta superfamily hydrolase
MVSAALGPIRSGTKGVAMRVSRDVIKVAVLAPLLMCLWCSIAQASPVVRARATEGGELLSYRSKILDEERILMIRLPEGYESSKSRYPVLFVLDGEYFLKPVTAAVQFLSECDYLLSQPMIPQLIVVGVVNVDRDRDFTPTRRTKDRSLHFPSSGRAGEFLEFLEHELIPILDDRYRTCPFRILSGWSLGGLFTVHTALNRPELFSVYLAVSPSLWWDDQIVVKQMERMFREDKVIDKPLVITLGSLEGGDMGKSVRDNFVPLVQNRHSGPAPFEYIEIVGEGHSYVPFKSWFEGLRAIYAAWRVPQEILNSGPAEIRKFFDKLSANYGYEVDVPQSACIATASTLYDRGEESAALKTALQCTEAYPRSPWVHEYLGRIYQALEQPGKARESYSRALGIVDEQTVPYSERRKSAAGWLRAVERQSDQNSTE